MLERFMSQRQGGNPMHGLVDGLGEAASTGKSRALISALTVKSGEGTGPAYIGNDRAKDLAVNVVLPFMHAKAALGQDPDGAAKWVSRYQEFPKLQENELTREMAHQLISPGWGKIPMNARRQQGLLHLHHLLTGGS